MFTTLMALKCWNILSVYIIVTGYLLNFTVLPVAVLLLQRFAAIGIASKNFVLRRTADSNRHLIARIQSIAIL